MSKFINFSQPLFGPEEKKEVWQAMDSGWVTLGPRVKQFEEQFAKYVGAKYAVGLNSCTAALHLAYIAAGIKKGDEVITTPFTFACTASMLLHLGAKPVFVDIDPHTFNIDPRKIEAKITKKTKAIVPVHYAGHPVELDAIMKIARKHKLIVIEDAAHAVGTKYKGNMIGKNGNMCCYSFHPIKNMSTGDGGMVTTNDAALAERISRLRLHGMTKDAWKRHSAAGSWRYDIAEAGFKYNMTDISAALGIHQLKKLNEFIKIRERYAKLYTKALSNIPAIILPKAQSHVRHAWNLFTIQVDTKGLAITRDEIVEELKKEGIGTSVYFIPLYHLTLFKSLKYKPQDYPMTERVFERIISLPIYPKMTAKDVLFVATTLKRIITKKRT